MSGEESAFDQLYTFRHLPEKKFSFLQDKDTLELFMKWSMLGRISAESYGFDQNFNPYNLEKFALCFFRDPAVISSLSNLDGGFWAHLSKPVASVSVENVPCSKVSMELFDPLYACGILWPSGHIVQCFNNVYQLYDKLRQMLQEEDCEYYNAIKKEERDEFLFRLFKHLSLGGEICQHEEKLDLYISTTKQIYKDLISVQKDPKTKKIDVVSTVLKVCVQDEERHCYLGTQEEEQTFAYLIVNPFKRHVTLFYHFYGVGNVTF